MKRSLHSALRDRLDRVRSILFPFQPASNINTIAVAAEFIAFNQVEGDYLEFGVHTGRSLIQAYHDFHRARQLLPLTLPFLERQPRFFAFDSFQGLPTPTGCDVTNKIPQHWLGEGVRDLGGDDRLLIKNLVRYGVDLSRVVVAKGWFSDTLTGDFKKMQRLERASLVHADCDFYESTVPVLNFVTGLLVEGSVIIFDDWFRYKNDPGLGQQGACREWLQRNPHIRLTELARHRSNSVAFIVNLSN